MKRIVRLIAVIIVLLVMVAVAAPFFVSADYLKAQLTEQVKAATGRTLTIKGKASIGILPSIAVKLEDVTLGNPAGFASPYFANIKTLSVGAELMPLLHKQVKVTDITVDGATLNLEEAASGAKNWDFNTSSKKAAAPEAKKPEAAPAEKGASPLTIDGIHIRNTAVSYRKLGAAPVKFDAKDISADIAMKGANTAVTLNQMALYEGNAKAEVSLDDQSNALALKANLDGVQVDPLMTALTGASKLTGAATVALDITGKNGEQAAMMRSLNGTASLKLNDGAVKGINVASFLRDLKQGFVMGNSTTEKTDFTELTASLKIVNGVASNEDLLMKSPVLRLTGKGSLDLAARTIDYRAVPSIVGTLKGQGGKDTLSSGGVDIPLLITGPWSAVSVSPDMRGVVQDAIKNPKALQQNLKDIGGAIGKFNSPKDIGGALFGGKKQ